ncbi:hypothetical protein BC793_112124 [Actinoplanes xinjiangensis]|uniref:Uncharacterized protein n=1 Tax=Actinoplanes xinjiangensis TaxID=512350 RepID=A0A316F960_9ACTN|nr:hypothetical protein BC793_112124 [Actinoplanes xinjiangensis]
MRSPRRSGPGCCSDPVSHRSGRTRRRRHPAPPGSLFRPVAPLSAVTRMNPLRVSTGRGRIERPRPSSATSRRPGTTTTHQRSHPVAVTLRPKAPVRPTTPTPRQRDRPRPPSHQTVDREHGRSPPPSTECRGPTATPTTSERDRAPPPFHQMPCRGRQRCPTRSRGRHRKPHRTPRPDRHRRPCRRAAVPVGPGGGATRGCPVRRGPRCRRPAGGVGVGPGAGRAEGLQPGSRWWAGPGPGWDQRWIRSR